MQPDDWVLEQGHGNLQVSTLMLLGPMRWQAAGLFLTSDCTALQELLAEQLSQAEHMRQRQQLDKRAIRLLLRSQQLSTFCRKSDLEALQEEFKQVSMVWTLSAQSRAPAVTAAN